MRGVLRWHEGDLDAPAELLERAFEIAEQVGRSEVAFESLHWLAAALRDRGDHADADQTLARALDLCERAGLVAQSVEATAARAVNLALWGRAEAAREVAEEAAEPRRAAALPGRPGRQPRGARRDRRRPRRAREAARRGRGRLDQSSAARSTPNAARRSQLSRPAASRQSPTPGRALPSYSRRNPSNSRLWPCSSWRIAITMSWVTGSMPSVSSTIRL